MSKHKIEDIISSIGLEKLMANLNYLEDSLDFAQVADIMLDTDMAEYSGRSNNSECMNNYSGLSDEKLFLESVELKEQLLISMMLTNLVKISIGIDNNVTK